jgi:hypothetical protein
MGLKDYCKVREKRNEKSDKNWVLYKNGITLLKLQVFRNVTKEGLLSF